MYCLFVAGSKIIAGIADGIVTHFYGFSSNRDRPIKAAGSFSAGKNQPKSPP
ncbi:hypothetical protein [Geitlerinema sp. PCC 9228]|jgi:hypothetical protein|uniref:hypothetical protein n=1 Tax=Geitlerinema sp. PCC 9228 TaxID=111611 RepID=UPI001FCCFC54|nr:hypothetical protein [Geitlerinema sp. PCC 9228]